MSGILRWQILMSFDKNKDKALKTSKHLLLLGKVPPPIGGVTIHVSRLLAHLTESSVPHVFYDLNRFSFFSYLKALYRSGFCHIHSSNPMFRLFSAILLLLFNKTSIITIHGNLGRFGTFKNLVDKFTLYVCTIPIVLNKDSLEIASKFNKNSRIISAFIPPLGEREEALGVQETVRRFISGKINVYCTNAYDLSFDKDENEIYGISGLIQVFSRLQDYNLIFSDPSGNYSGFLKNKGIQIPENILVIAEPHSFIEIIKRSDGLLRTTTTDGDSLSVKEGLFYEKRVICSDCVQRPEGCEIFKTGDWENFTEVLEQPEEQKKNTIQSGFEELEKLYKILQ
jgi:hypothetical protein